ncbi:MAG: hypothetical protein IT208_14235 [Chthonomonadales bacterium]|nr:hypothetical protein [Chthonomonadales bacterium]
MLLVVSTRTALAVASLTAILCTATVVSARAAETQAPRISFGSLTPYAVVRPDAYGRIYIPVRATDDTGLQSVVLSVPHATATLTPSNRPPWALVRAMWDSGDDAVGVYTITCTAVDVTGKVTTESLPITLAR